MTLFDAYCTWCNKYLKKILDDQADTSDNSVFLAGHLDDLLRRVWATLQEHLDMCTAILQHMHQSINAPDLESLDPAGSRSRPIPKIQDLAGSDWTK